MTNVADLQNYTRRFWRGQTSSPMVAGAKILEVVSIDEIEKMSGYTPKTLRVFAMQDNFPSPVARMGKRQLLYRKDDVCRWIAIKKELSK